MRSSCRGLVIRGPVLALSVGLLVTTLPADAQTYQVLHAFDVPPRQPYAGLVRDATGNLYGTTFWGGAYNQGTVFKLDSSGNLTTLHSFDSGDSRHDYGGWAPFAALILDSGNLYGTTYGDDGSSSRGTVFKLDSSDNMTTLHTFIESPDGAHPNAAVVLDDAGNLYGTTSDGQGTVFRLDSSGNLTTLHDFNNSEGYAPSAPLILDGHGNLYGTTVYGDSSFGTVFKIDSSGNLTTLHSLNADGSEGTYLQTALVIDGAGNLYGTTYGGTGSDPAGTVFKLDSSGNLTTLHRFNGSDGSSPSSALVLDGAGNLYGTTANSDPGGEGTVFKLDSSGNLTTLHRFSGPDGAHPYGPLVLDDSGHLYGTTADAGPIGRGTVFKLDSGGNLTTLHDFHSSDGANPNAALVRDGSGSLYGTTFEGGSTGYGTVFKLDVAGNLTTLYSFSPSDGASPAGALLADGNGNLYGTTYVGGAYNYGTVFKLDASHNLTTLHSFNSTDGARPWASLAMDDVGNLYGTTSRGGPIHDYGTIFKLDLSANLTTLHSFSATDGAYPLSALTRDAMGNLYGTTSTNGNSTLWSGTVFKLDTSGTLTTLHNFIGPDGGWPWASLLLNGFGDLYGTTVLGGSNDRGTVFKVDSSGNSTTLYNFYESDGRNPHAALIFDSSGNLYGTTSGGGSTDSGTVFRLDSSGNRITLHDFNFSDGAEPNAALIFDGAGNLYGTTYKGGPGGGGVVFRLTLSCAPSTAVASGSNTIRIGSSTPLFGSGGVACSWSPATGLSDATSCSPMAFPASTTTYTLTVTDEDGCSSTNSSTATVTVLAATTTELASSSNPSATGQPVTLTATVVSQAGSSTGTVTFRDGVIAVGTVVLDGAGHATLTTSSLATDSHVITAFYSGDGTFASSMSVPLSQVVTNSDACANLGPAVSYPVDGYPAAIALGDFNGDGRPDLATANRDSNSLSVLVGNGDGTFQAAVDYAAGTSPVSVAAGDFNDDGNLDLVTANQNSNDSSVLLGNGDASFQAAVNYGAGIYPASVAVADINSDGKIDVAVGNSGSEDVSILLGHGDGTFHVAANSRSNGDPLSLAVGDFNGDAKPDLAAGLGIRGAISVMLGNGDGTFQYGVLYLPGSPEHRHVAVADFNGDGRLDLVSSEGVVGPGNGDGTFQYSGLGFSPGALFVTVSDFDGNGTADLACTRPNGVSIKLGNGDGTFQDGINYDAGIDPVSTAAGDPVATVAGDFDGDGRADLAVANAGPGDVSVLLGSCQATHLSVSAPASATTANAVDTIVTALDMNGHVAPSYLGTVHLTSTDSAATLPADYTFTAVDSGVHAFSVTFNTAGSQTLTVADAGNGAITGTSAAVIVTQSTHTLTVTKIGTSTGAVTSSPAGVNCGAMCSKRFNSSTVVTLTPTPGSGAVFGGWSGDPDCADGSVTMDAAKTCTAAFNSKPDLVVSVVGAPSTAAQGQVIAVTDTTQNNNTGGPAFPGTSTTRFYLSVDATLGAGDVEIGLRGVPQLGPNASSAGSTNVTIPAATSGGSYSIIAMADAGSVVPETNEGNNTRTRSITIGSDLSVSALSAPGSSGAGLTLIISDTAKAAGNAAQAPASTTAFYLSIDGVIDAGDALLGGHSVPVLSPGASSASSTTVLIPAGTGPGIYSIIARADDLSAVVETVETNNTRSVSITIGPDIVVSALSAPGSVSRGATVSINCTTKNQGGGSTGVSTTTKFYFSTDAILDGGDTLLGARTIPVLAPGASDSSTTSVTIPTGLPPCGNNACSLIAVSDADSTVAELAETNNIRVRGMKVN